MKLEPRRPMSDQEWRARFDPEGVAREELQDRLDKIINLLEEREDLPTKYPD